MHISLVFCIWYTQAAMRSRGRVSCVVCRLHHLFFDDDDDHLLLFFFSAARMFASIIYIYMYERFADACVVHMYVYVCV